MNHSIITDNLYKNLETFKSLLSGIEKTEYLFRPDERKWCLLEIVCHLYDEELFDFKARVKHTIENAEGELVRIDPEGWVKSKNYIDWNYYDTLKLFLEERRKSVEWLASLKNPEWKNEYVHPKFGECQLNFFCLTGWLMIIYISDRSYLQSIVILNIYRETLIFNMPENGECSMVYIIIKI